jgi:hypothetical protein
MGEEKKKPSKLSYEDLANITRELEQRCRIYEQKLKENNMISLFKRLDYLFKVVEFGDKFPKEFKQNSITEIVSLMTPETEEEEKDGNGK